MATMTEEGKIDIYEDDDEFDINQDLQTRNWLELPSDLMVNILKRVGVIDILENVQKVCTAWHDICKDPALWMVVYIDYYSYQISPSKCDEMCKHIVDRSQGQLVDLAIIGCCDDEILHYVVDRSSQLKRLEIYHFFGTANAIRSEELFKKLSMLEELSLIETEVQLESIKALGSCCPLLKTLKLNLELRNYRIDFDEIALAIGNNLPSLTHLEVIRSRITNTGLRAILDGCCHLETLDLRWCLYINLKGELGKRCSKEIKNLKLPTDPIESTYL